jgi:hypothetical protein
VGGSKLRVLQRFVIHVGRPAAVGLRWETTSSRRLRSSVRRLERRRQLPLRTERRASGEEQLPPVDEQQPSLSMCYNGRICWAAYFSALYTF